MDVKGIIQENKHRAAVLNAANYQPVWGIGSPLPRMPLKIDDVHTLHLPVPMTDLEYIKGILQFESLVGFVNYVMGTDNRLDKRLFIDQELKKINLLRLDYDFEYWAATCATIQNKEGDTVSFVLNNPQRLLLAQLEKLRTEGKPIRVVLLKARQWGGSTLIQLYMSWIQLRVKTGWNSAIVTTVENQARHIRGMLSRMASNYPAGIGGITFKPYEGSNKNREIDGRGCVIGIGSYEEPENLRSFTFQMLHLSEVGSWRKTAMRTAENFVQAIRSTVPRKPDTIVVLESTAKGVGNFFHREWLAAKEALDKGTGGYHPMFIPWFAIEEYALPIPNYPDFIHSMSSHELDMWELGATLEGIYWYRTFRISENYSEWMMSEEYPSTDTEAFQSSGHRIFPLRFVLHLRRNCLTPERVGELRGRTVTGKDSLKDIEFHEQKGGCLFVWSPPDKTVHVSNRYAIFVDIGGRTKKADYSVIRVIDRYWMIEGGCPEFVATWRGHIDHDLLAWKAAQIATWYNNALLAIEDNSLDKDNDGMGHFFSILDQIADHYKNLYARMDPDKTRQGIPAKYGFHTSRQTKAMIIDRLLAAARDDEYTERDIRACDEMDTFEEKPDKRMGAQDGCKDDMVITTAGAVWLATEYLSLPKVVKEEDYIVKQKVIISEATI